MPRWGIRAIHWVNQPLINGYRPKRIDALLVAQGLGVTAYYAYTSGPMAALMGLSMYAFVVMISLWF